MRRLWAWLKHVFMATDEESARFSAIDDEITFGYADPNDCGRPGCRVCR